jgi:phage replication O-like protein O
MGGADGDEGYPSLGSVPVRRVEESLMANPQLENGHLELANEIIDSLAGIRISGTEWQVLWVILRKTYGWHKKLDVIPLSQFCAMTGLSKPHVIRSVKKLLDKRVIIVFRNGNGTAAYGFNKDFDKWKPLPGKQKLPCAGSRSSSSRKPGGEWVCAEDGRVRGDNDAGKSAGKETYGRHVRLSADECRKLAERFHPGILKEVIEFFDLKIESKGVRQWRRDHESDYATILYWERNGWIRLGTEEPNAACGAFRSMSASSRSIVAWAEREGERLRKVESRK